MGWRNPPVPWSELERKLSGRPGPAFPGDAYPGDAYPGDGGDSPAWSRKREPYRAPEVVAPPVTSIGNTPYAELHCHSNFSFLDGASHPEELVEEAVRLGLEALALTDHNGFYGVVRFAGAARELALPTVFGAELRITDAESGSRGGGSGSGGAGEGIGPTHLVALARDPVGYAQLGRIVSTAQLAGEKGEPRISLAEVVEVAATDGGDHLLVLTGCRQGAVPRALVDDGPAVARRRLDELADGFGRHNVVVELWDHGHPLDSARNDALAELAVGLGVDVVATNNVHYHAPHRRRLATAMAAVGGCCSLEEIDAQLPAAGLAHLRSGAEQARWFARFPGVVERAAEIGRDCAFDLSLVAPELPPFPCPSGHDEMSWLRELTEQGAVRRYGSRGAERVPGAYAQIDHELDLIEQLGFPGYFLVVWDIVEFCRRAGILCQGRGSAANSAVCYALGITNADAVSLGLLFERFLSPERDGPPDIDVDIESGRREEVIQYVYESYGRWHTAQVANVITYRAKSSVRDMAKALGYATGQQDAFSKSLDRWSGLAGAATTSSAQVPAPPSGPTSTPAPEPGAVGDAVPDDVMALAREIEHFPRHLGIHSGGMVICDRPVVEVCPVEWGRMADRSVLQWDKDDCAAVGLVKFDLLGLGMLTAIHEAIDLIAVAHGITVDLAALPQEDEVYDMLCLADSIGVFQVESRAQMATLPRLRPRTFYDLVVEVALIRPGPIQGGSVHPYIRRRNGKEPVTYLHPLLERSLAKTLGIPLFQEQLMQMAIDVAGFSAGEADQLRQAMGSKRSRERMERLRERLYAGMADKGVTGEVADQIYDKLAAFANFGFPESHSVSFAYLVYASSWIKYHYPAAFCAALLNAQPMGFYSPHSLVQDARRHGVRIVGPDINASGAKTTLVGPDINSSATATPLTWPDETPPPVELSPRLLCDRTIPQPQVVLGLEYVRHVGEDLAVEIERGRPYSSIEDLRRRRNLSADVLEALATAGAFDSFGVDRRSALWTAGAVAHTGDDRLDGVVTGLDAPQLPGMSDEDLAHADLWATGISVEGHPTRFLRDELDRIGVVPADRLIEVESRSSVLVGGVVTHRQRPATAGGTTFLNLEDETGLINVVVSKGCWTRYRRVARSAPAMLIRGRLEKNEGVINVIADRLEPLPVGVALRSRDFR